MKPIRIAQIGTGHDHAPAAWASINKNKDYFDVVGIAEPVDEYKERFKTDGAYKNGKVFTLEELLNMDDLDAVVIEAGKEYEIEYAKLFAEKGIPVQLDKPGSHDARAFEEFMNTMKSKNLPVGLGYMYRFNPLVKQAYDLMKEGKLGDVFSVEAQMSVRHDTNKRRWLGRYKGGMMYYLGCHLVDMVCMFKGIPDEIIPYNGCTGNEGLTSEDYGFAVMMYNGIPSFVKTCASEVNGFDRRQLVISGTRGTYEIRPWEVHAPGGQYTEAKVTLLDNNPPQWSNGAENVMSGVYDRYDEMMIHFAKRVRGEDKMMFDYRHEIDVMKSVIRACGAENSVK